MNIQDILGIGVVGVLLAAVVQGIKAKFGTESIYTKIITVALAIAFGSVYVLFRDTAIFQTILVILGTASTIYAFILK